MTRTLYVDSDACPVKEEILRVAIRHGLNTIFIGNRWMRGLDHRGKIFDDASIGMALAMRDLMTGLRDAGDISGGGPAPYGKQDRSRFLDGLERLIQTVTRGKVR